MILWHHINPQAFFLEHRSISLFSVFYFPIELAPTEVILLVPPFADEMNKSRRMITLQAQRFCAMGYAVLVVDLLGTGDSSGDFSDATWEVWQENLQYVLEWSRREYGFQTFHFWGIRLGCLLVLDMAKRFQLPASNFLFWQPAINGDRYVTQLFRLRLAEQFGKKNNETVKSLRERSSSGESLEIAGYTMKPELLNAIGQLNFTSLTPLPGAKVVWLECFAGEQAELLPGSRTITDQWQDQGISVQTACVSGSAFWNSVEIEQVPELIQKSSTMFGGLRNVSN